jgi:hypothetical protein
LGGVDSGRGQHGIERVAVAFSLECTELSQGLLYLSVRQPREAVPFAWIRGDVEIERSARRFSLENGVHRRPEIDRTRVGVYRGADCIDPVTPSLERIGRQGHTPVRLPAIDPRPVHREPVGVQ